jgi:predicted nucleic acid-binding protein
VAALVDTNILVYQFDPRVPRKQAIARSLLRNGAKDRSIRLAYQTLVEFRAAISRPTSTYGPLLKHDDAALEMQTFLNEFDVIYPDADILRTALRGVTAHQLSWYDALMWAYAENSGLTELISEDFQHGRTYGRVRAVNPFV